MQEYADYGFYIQSYCGTMEESDFNRHILSASQYIRYLTQNASDRYEGEELKYAACAAADLYCAACAGEPGKTVKSENNDGYSVTYVTEGTDGETKEELVSRKIYAEVRKWLLPTGLLRRKVRCAHDCQRGHYHL